MTTEQHTASPSWRDRGERPEAHVLIIPDLGRSRGNSYEIFVDGQPAARRSSLVEAKEFAYEKTGIEPDDWQQIEGDQQDRYDKVHGFTRMFNDAQFYLVPKTANRLSDVAQAASHVLDEVPNCPECGAKMLDHENAHTASLPRVLYHISETSNRDSIREHGLWAGEGGVWMHSDPEKVRGHTKGWAPLHGFDVEPHDIWEVTDPDDLRQGGHAEDQMSAAEHVDDEVYVTYTDVPPSKVHLVDAHTLQHTGAFEIIRKNKDGEPDEVIVRRNQKIRLSNPRVQVKQGTPNTADYLGVGFSGQAWRFWIEDPDAPPWLVSESDFASDKGKPMMGNFAGSPEHTVAFLDVFESRDGDWIDVAFMTTRGPYSGAGDYTHQGLAGLLMKACYDKFAPKKIYWGKIMHDDAGALKERFRREMPERTGSHQKMAKTASSTTDYLDAIIEMRNRYMKSGITTTDALIRKFGKHWTRVGKGDPPRGLQRGPKRNCFGNAMHAAIANPDLIYCEGYANAVIPTMHAWCVDGEGTVWDPTWDEEQGRDYYGIPFNIDFVVAWTMAKGTTGVLPFDAMPADEVIKVMQTGHFPPDAINYTGSKTAGEDYWIGHRPTEGPPAYDLLAPDEEQGVPIMPDDIYDHPEYYTGFREKLPALMRTLRRVRGNPDAQVAIYRSLPAGQTTIRTGDWVSLDKEYAASNNLDPDDPVKDMPVITAMVAAKDVKYAGDDLMEWGYFGPPVTARVAGLKICGSLGLGGMTGDNISPEDVIGRGKDYIKALAAHFDVPVPVVNAEFKISSKAADYRRKGAGSLITFYCGIPKESAFELILAHEFAHHLLWERGVQPADPDAAHGPEFDEVLTAVLSSGVHLSASKEASIPFLHLVGEPAVDPKDISFNPSMASYDWVTPYLATGGAILYASGLRQLARDGVTGVISGRSDFDDHLLDVGRQTGIDILWLPLHDDGTSRPTSWFKEAIDFALPILKRGGKIYCHCTGGHNRGPSLAYAVLRAYSGADHEMAMAKITQARDVAVVAYAGDADRALHELGYTKSETPDIEVPKYDYVNHKRMAIGPVTLYHGTSVKSARDMVHNGARPGVNLTSNIEAAKQYARYASGGMAFTKDKRKQGVVLEILVHPEETKVGEYGANDSYITDHQVTVVPLPVERIKSVLDAKSAAVDESQWLINGKPYHEETWIEVEPDLWYRGTAYPNIPAKMVVKRDGDKWAWEVRVLTFIGAPHEDRGWDHSKSPKGTAKTLEDAQARAEKSITKDHEFFQRYDERQRAKMAVGSFTEYPDYVPTIGMWGPPQDHLDPRIFEADNTMRADVRRYVLDSLDAFWTPLYGDWQKWTKVYLAGSAAAYWWNGDTDLDILLGIDLDRLRAERPANQLVSDEDIFAHLNAGLINTLRPTMDSVYVLVPSQTWRDATAGCRSLKVTLTNGSGSTSKSGTASWTLRAVREHLDPASRITSEGAELSLSPDGVLDSGVLGQFGRSVASSVEGSTSEQPDASPVTSDGGSTSGWSPDTASRWTSSSDGSKSREGVAQSASRLAQTSSSITTTPVAQPRPTRAEGVSGGFSVGDATTPSDTSETRTSLPQPNISEGQPIEVPDGFVASGPIHVTYFANPGSWDIADLKPYAAYDITVDTWVVRPPEVPKDWGWKYIDPEVIRRCQQMAREAEEILALPQPERTAAGVQFFDWIHLGRKVAYSPAGAGWLDPGNLIYAYLEQHPDGLLRRLYLCKHPEDASPTEIAKGQQGVVTAPEMDINYLPEFTTLASVLGAMFDYSDEDMAELAEKHKGEPVHVMHRNYDDAFLAMVNGVPVGQLTYERKQDTTVYSEDDAVAEKAKGDYNGYYVQIDALAVDKHWRRQGVGTELLKAFTEWADSTFGFLGKPHERRGWDPGSFSADGAAFWRNQTGETVPVTQRVTYGSLNLDALPKSMGETSIPSGTIRCYHYTTTDAAESIARSGLLERYARGDGGMGAGNEPSAGIWAATGRPATSDGLKGPANGSGQAVIEFWVKPDQIGQQADYPWNGEDLVAWGKGYHHIIVRGDVPANQIAAVHLPWHSSARYVEEAKLTLDDVPAGLSADYDKVRTWMQHRRRTASAMGAPVAGKSANVVAMAYDVCILKGDRGRCASWPILDPSTQVHPGLHLGGAGNGVCISHAKSLVRDIKRGDMEVTDSEGNPTDIEGHRLDGEPDDPEWRRRIERVHDVYRRSAGASYLKKSKAHG